MWDNIFVNSTFEFVFDHFQRFIDPEMCNYKSDDYYRGYHIRLYHLVIGRHTLKSAIHLVLGSTTLDCNTWSRVEPH